MRAFYNEIDPNACAWISNLMDAGAITPGVICDRSIEDIFPDELIGFDRVHLFAGIAVWDFSLNRAGWGNAPVWTASCPCQPFSAAGKGLAFADERHLWPALHWLIAQCRPLRVFGEQVASKAVDDWIDLVQADVEALDYSFGCVPFPSAGIGAPHIRDRTYWVALAGSERRQGERLFLREGQSRLDLSETGRCGEVDGLADTNGGQFHGQSVIRGTEPDRNDTGRPQGRSELVSRSELCGLADANNAGLEGRRGMSERASELAAGSIGMGSGVADAESQRRDGGQDTARPRGWACIEADSPADCVDGGGRPGPVNGLWRDADWLFCRDGKWRPVEGGTQPLAPRSTEDLGRVRTEQEEKLEGSRQTRLKGYGNAVNSEAARIWIETCMEVMQ